MAFALNVVVSALVISFASWLSGRFPTAAGFIVALPLATMLVLPLSYQEHGSAGTSIALAKSILVAIPISLTFFVPFLLAGRLALSFCGGGDARARPRTGDRLTPDTPLMLPIVRLARRLQRCGVRTLAGITRARLRECAPEDSQDNPDLAALVRQLDRYFDAGLSLYPGRALTRIEQRITAYTTYLEQVRDSPARRARTIVRAW